MAELAGRGQPWNPPEPRKPERAAGRDADLAELSEMTRQVLAWAQADTEAEPETAAERPAAWHPGEREPYDPAAEPWLHAGPQAEPPDLEAGS